MTEVKMPEPAGTICFDGGRREENWVSSQSAYSDDQLKQYGDDRAREALEMAAKELERTTTQKAGKWNIEWTVPVYPTTKRCIKAIHELAKEIK